MNSNYALKKFGLFFGPETSTANRCNIGGMLGNNACGSHSLVYGSTRDHTIEIKALLSDGSEALFGSSKQGRIQENAPSWVTWKGIFTGTLTILSDTDNQRHIIEGYPDPDVERRNTGYALDLLLNSEPFHDRSDNKFNFCKLLAGSEGTLAVSTEIKLNLVPLPPSEKALVCVHLRERNDAFRANLVALKHNPSAVEMMDNRILKLTENNISQRNNRFFLDGDPGAILIVEFVRKEHEEILPGIASAMITALKAAGYGYSFPVVTGKDISRVWDLRKAGLGVLANMKGDPKPVTLMEDTAINVKLLPDYIDEIEKMLARYGKDSVFHAHIGTGELHIRPILTLKDPKDVKLFRTIGTETAKIVKKYRGSLKRGTR